MNTLVYFFECLDELDSQKRDEIFGFIYEMILRPRRRKAVTGKETMKSLQIDEVNYDLFKARCFEMARMERMGGLDGMALVYFIVAFVLQQAFSFADSTSLDKVIEGHKLVIAYHQKLIKEGDGDFEENISNIEYSQKHIDELPERVQRNYQLYTYLCENLIERLFAEKYLLLERFKPEPETDDDKFYNFSLQWYLAQGEQEREKPTKASTSQTRKKASNLVDRE